MKNEKQFREIKVRIPEDTYSLLEKIVLKEGFSSVSDYVSFIILNTIKERVISEDISEKLKSKLERYIQDELNKRLSVVETLRRQVMEVYEKMEELEQKINSIESALKEGKIEEKAKVEVPRKTAIERLREEKVVYESKLPSRIQRDRLFSYFERMGVIVIKLSRERIAVDPDFWRDFKYKLLNELNSNREEDILSVLGDKGYELWKTLYADNMLVYDPKAKKWKFIHGEMP
ncbi:MAG: CopG family transcriptional regulator [Desulfurococcaceae archaeon]